MAKLTHFVQTGHEVINFLMLNSAELETFSANQNKNVNYYFSKITKSWYNIAKSWYFKNLAKSWYSYILPRISYTLAASSENVHSSMRKMCRFRSSCGCAWYHPAFALHSYICSIRGFCQRLVKALIRLRICAG